MHASAANHVTSPAEVDPIMVSVMLPNHNSHQAPAPPLPPKPPRGNIYHAHQSSYESFNNNPPITVRQPSPPPPLPPRREQIHPPPRHTPTKAPLESRSPLMDPVVPRRNSALGDHHHHHVVKSPPPALVPRRHSTLNNGLQGNYKLQTETGSEYISGDLKSRVIWILNGQK